MVGPVGREAYIIEGAPELFSGSRTIHCQKSWDLYRYKFQDLYRHKLFSDLL